MSENLLQLFTTQFSTNLELKLQQSGSKLRGKVLEGTHVGKQASPMNQIGAIALKAPAGRFAPKNRTDADFTRRWVFPQDGEIDQLIDSFDELKTIVDPKSQYVSNAANAVGRGWDDCIILNATASAQVGTDANGLTAETFDTTKYQIAVNFNSSAASGLTVDKLIETKRIATKYHNDLDVESITLVIGSQQEADLLRQAQVVSTEFNDKPVLVDGRVRRFLGFDIVTSERLPYSRGAANQRGVLAFVKSGMYLGMWKDQTNSITIRNDLSGQPWDLYTSVSFGATRTQPGKLFEILCADTSGADITA